jgi:hypothetical protein
MGVCAVTASPYDMLLTQMREVLDIVDGQNLNDNSLAREVFDECARKIHAATAPDPLHRIETRPPAIDEALADARQTGDGFLHSNRRDDGALVWERVPSRLVVLRSPTKQGETPS